MKKIKILVLLLVLTYVTSGCFMLAKPAWDKAKEKLKGKPKTEDKAMTGNAGDVGHR